jgi:pimeloyl-ACP methyl ester carboxylesterase
VHVRIVRAVAATLLAVLVLGLAVVAGPFADGDANDPVGAVVAPTTASPSATGAEAERPRPTGAVDRLVAVDGGRLHLRCRGAGRTTVLLLAGWGDGGEGWVPVQTAVSRQARVCAYSRFGTGTSDPPPTTQTFATQVATLHELLDVAGEVGPYVVAGHSFGGAEAVTFAATYPEEVTGLLLLDASPATWPATACSVAAWDALCTAMHDPGLDPERLDVIPAFEAVASVSTLGDLPMAVVTAAHRTAPELSAAELARVDRIWAAGQARWAALSTSSTIVRVEGTGHHVELDRPSVVIEQLRRLLA